VKKLNKSELSGKKYIQKQRDCALFCHIIEYSLIVFGLQYCLPLGLTNELSAFSLFFAFVLMGLKKNPYI
jgi:hypothetical protein